MRVITYALLALVARAHVKDVLIDSLVNGFFDRTIATYSSNVDAHSSHGPGSSIINNNPAAYMDHTALGKQGQVVARSPTRLQSLVPMRTIPPGQRMQFRNDMPSGRVQLRVSTHRTPQLVRNTRVSALDHIHTHGMVDLATIDLLSHQVGDKLRLLSNLPAEWLAWYDKEAITFPLATKSTTAGVCYSIGDLCAQSLAGKNVSTLDFGRFVRSGTAGFVGFGIPAHYLQTLIHDYMSFGGAWWAIVPKFAVTTGPMTWAFMSLYSFMIGALQFQDPRETLKDVREVFVPSFKAGIRFWPAIDLTTLTLIPVELQVLWVGVAKIFWICILSRINNEGVREETLLVDPGLKEMRGKMRA